MHAHDAPHPGSLPADQPALAEHLRQQLHDFFAPLLQQLDRKLDARLVRTFLGTLAAILSFRHPKKALLLSELGTTLLDPAHAPAGVKRFQNLLASPKWHVPLLQRYLWQAAAARVEALRAAGETPLLVWDESVLEKPESRTTEGLGVVRSSKAKRLLDSRRGNAKLHRGAPVFVPGWHWLALLVLGERGPVSRVTMRWWAQRLAVNPPPENPVWTRALREVQRGLLRRCARTWGNQVVHVWDRGSAGGPWLGEVLRHGLRFVLRWPSGWG